MESVPIINCPTCGSLFTRRANENWKKYCKKECVPKLLESICESCGKSFPKKLGEEWRKFCTKQCSDNAKNLVQPTSICEKCNKVFQKKQGEEWRKYCSKKCSDDAKVIQQFTTLDINISTCNNCGKSFSKKQGENWRKYCSKQCAPEMIESKCQNCGKQFKRKAGENWRKYCSKECDKKIQLVCKGCNKTFFKKAANKWRKYCSKECTPEKVESKCEKCCKIFYHQPNETWRKFCSKQCSVEMLNCKRCGISFAKNLNEPWMVCCSQQCFDLLLIIKNCAKCNQPFQVINTEKWKQLCGRSTCYETTNNDGKIHTKPFSVKAIIWLEEIAQHEHINIQHAKNGGEYTIQMGHSFIRFDGFCKETNTVFEFHGDYWHGNPKLYDPNLINKDTGCTFGQLYEKTILREEFILSQKYYLFTIWESDFDNLVR